MMENKFVKVKGIDNSEIIELPLDFDNTLSFAVLKSQFPYSSGLKYRNPKNNQIRTVRKTDGRFFLSVDLNWDDFVFFCFCPQSKRKLIQNGDEKSSKTHIRESILSMYRKFPETFDLVAIGMSFDTTERELEEYLGRFGALMYCKLKYNEPFGQSQGVAFFRFLEIRAQNLCLGAVHVVNKTNITIKIPNEKISIKESKSSKLFISNVPNTFSREDIRAYFSQYGQVIHVFIPPDKRCFAFVTFLHEMSIEKVIKNGHVHCFNGARVYVNRVLEKEELANSATITSVENNPQRKRKMSEEDYNGRQNKPKICKPDQLINSGDYEYQQQSENSFFTSHFPNTFNKINFSYSTHPSLESVPFPSHKISLPDFSVSPPSLNIPPYSVHVPPFPVISNLSSTPFPPNYSQQFSSCSVPVYNDSQKIFQKESQMSKSNAIHLPQNLNSRSFQYLLVKEIISQYQQEQNQKYLQSGKISEKQKCFDECFSKCGPLKNLVNKMCLLKDTKFPKQNSKKTSFETINKPKHFQSDSETKLTRSLDVMVELGREGKNNCHQKLK